MPKFTPSADLLKQGSDAAAAQAKKLKIDIPKPAVESSASSLVSPASEPALGTADIDTTRVRKTRRRGSGGKPKRQGPAGTSMLAPVIATVPSVSTLEEVGKAPSAPKVTAAPFEEPSWVDLVKDDKSTVMTTKSEPIPKVVAEEKEDEYASGKVFAEEYLKLNPLPEAGEEKAEKKAEEKAVPPKEVTPTSFEIHEGKYRAASNGVVRTITKETKKNGKDIYYETFETGEITEYRSLKALNKVAEKEGWQLEPDAIPQMRAQAEQIPFSEKASVLPGAEAAPTSLSPEASENKFSELEKNLEEARRRYAKNDFENTSTLRKLSAFFRLDKTKYEGLDVDGAKAEYDKAFQALLDARLGDIRERRESGQLDEAGYRREMGETLKSFECEGRIKIFQARQQVHMESLAQSKIGWLIEGIPRLAHAYNKLPKSARFAIGAALGIGALVAGPGAGVAAAATWIALARGTVGGLGMFATVDSTLDAISDTRAGKAVEKSGGTMFTEYEGLLAPESRTAEEIAAAKEQFIREKLEKLHGHFDDRVKGMKRRKVAAVIAGVAFGTAVGSGWLGEKIKGLFGTGEVPSAPIEAHSGDSTWKLLNQYLSAKDSHFSGMNEAQKTYAIDALKDKLQAMSPKDLIEGGFESGDISKLGIGEHIDFDKLVGSSITEAMQGASGLSSEAVESITQNNAGILEWARAHPGVKLTDTVVDNILHGNAADTISGKVTEIIDAALKPSGVSLSLDGAAAPLAEVVPIPPVHEILPNAGLVFTAELQPRVDDWYMQIFRSENAGLNQDWVFNKAAIAKIKVWDILQDAKRLQQGSFTGYVTGLQSEQIENFAEFSQNVAKNNIGFDGAAFFRENPGATVMDYLKKVAPLVEQGQRLGLYTATH